ncbi:MAG: acetyltransferase [Verrucomicrobiota bacterium]
MAKVIIFGQRDYAAQALYYLTHDSPHEVVAFSVTDDQCKSDAAFGLPLIPFEEIQDRFPPDDHHFLVPMSGRSMNRLREQFYLAAKEKGYPFISYVSSKAITCQNEIGENCFILENTNIQPFVRIGNNVVIWCHNHIGHHSTIEDHVWMGSGVIISGRCTIGSHSYLASKTLIEANLRLAQGTLTGSTSYLKKNTEPWTIHTGNPATQRKVSSKDFDFL